MDHSYVLGMLGGLSNISASYESESLPIVSEAIDSLSLPVCPASCLAPTSFPFGPLYVPLPYTHPMPQACTTST